MNMTYVLEQITPADQQKIILDATGNSDIRNSLDYALKKQNLVKTWSIDRSSGHYLLRAPVIVKEDADDRNYYFYFNGWLYRFSVFGAFGSDAGVADYQKPLGSLLSQFQEEVRAALAVYGEYGSGRVSGEDALEALALNPIFKKGAK